MPYEIPTMERLRLGPYTLSDEVGLFDVFADADARPFTRKCRTQRRCGRGSNGISRTTTSSGSDYGHSK